MNLNFFEELEKSIEEKIGKKIDKVEGIENEELELAHKLDAIEEYTIDRFEENIVVLEDRKSGKMKNVERNKIAEECEEGDILKCINGKYILDKEETKRLENDIQDKYKNLWE